MLLVLLLLVFSDSYFISVYCFSLVSNSVFWSFCLSFTLVLLWLSVFALSIFSSHHCLLSAVSTSPWMTLVPLSFRLLLQNVCWLLSLFFTSSSGYAACFLVLTPCLSSSLLCLSSLSFTSSLKAIFVSRFFVCGSSILRWAWQNQSVPGCNKTFMNPCSFILYFEFCLWIMFICWVE